MAGQLLEPQRFALIVGNGLGYTGSSLPALGTPCNDIEAVAGSLKEMGWTDVVTACDLTASEMRSRIYDFTSKVVRTERAFGLLYFSGHAVEINGTNYLFGKDANIDTDVEVRTALENPEASLFGDSAVNIDFEINRLNNGWGRGVLVVLDACRDNPIIDAMQAAGITGIRYPTKTSNATGVMYAFATADGARAPGGLPGSVSLYTKVWAEHIVREGREKELSILANRVNTDMRRRTRNKQRPDTGGSLLSPPFFCIAGCPSTVDQWASYGGQFYSGGHEVGAVDSTVERPSGVEDQRGDNRLGRVASLMPDQPVLVASADSADAQEAQSDVSGQDQSAAPIQTIRTDVFWCDGDDLADERHDRADRVADVISTIKGPMSGIVPGPVRVRVLPKKVNAQDRYKLNDDVVYHDRGARGEKTWAEILSQKVQTATGQVLEVRQTDLYSLNYTSVFVCDGALASRVRARVYVQVSHETQREMADKISRYISKQVPKATLSTGIELRPDAPADTEIRYFADRERPTAVAIGEVMRNLLGHAVPAKFMTGYEASLAGAPVIELWYGKTEDLSQVSIGSSSQ
ncbi:caspase family protein [Mesorhizobium caraganae]|uniref:Caspase family protein n=1 Tax=Mesorhizobium caraganae TaxID=483206 RepID=A0ABV1YZW9_9HYPH